MSWKKLDSTVVFDNPWMTVREDHVINPGGGENQYGYVHFKNVAVAVIPLDEDMHTWLVGQTRYTLGKYSWEVPMGGAPIADDPLESARRELREETGLSANRWSEIMRLHPSNSITDESAVVYVAQELTQGNASPEETENLELRRLPLSDALDMVLHGEITDAISCAALMRVSLLSL